MAVRAPTVHSLVILDLELPGCERFWMLCVGFIMPCRSCQLSRSRDMPNRASQSRPSPKAHKIACSRKTLDLAALVQVAARNAMARHKSQQSLVDDRTLLRALMKHIPDAIYFKDTASRVLMISEAHAQKFHRADTAAAIGKTDHDFFSGPHADQALTDEKKIMRTGQPLVGFEEMETWPDGSETWVSTTKMPLRDAAGRVIGTFGISRDITERKRMQDALALRTRQLEQKNLQIAEELKMARELQLAMLPQEYPSFLNGDKSAVGSALEFFSFYHPTGAVSGDFFTVTALSDSKVGVFICDVMGLTTCALARSSPR